MISEKFKEWWRKYDDVEKCRLIKDKAIEVNRIHLSMVRASNRELLFKGSRIGPRGGKQTTIAAFAMRYTDRWLSSVEELKYMVSTL